MLRLLLGVAAGGPWRSAEGQSLPVPREGLKEILLGRSMD